MSFTELQLEIVPDLWTTNEPDAYMVYAEHPEGGYVTLFYGTKAACENFVKNHDPSVKVKQKPRFQQHNPPGEDR